MTYSNQIARLLQKRCVECHRPGQIGPFALQNYEEVAGWAEMIDEVVREQRMPPWFADPKFGHFMNDSALTNDEKNLIYEVGGRRRAEGNPKDLPSRSNSPAAG